MTTPQPVKLPMLKLHELDESQHQLVHRAAQVAFISAATHRQLTPEWTAMLGDLGQQYVHGVFITVSRGNQLRGCCGFLGNATPLREALVQTALKTAREDFRLPAISPAEVSYLQMNVTLLHAPALLPRGAEERAAGIEIGKHGLRISRDGASAILLPSVAKEQGWDAKEFLRSVARKAGLHEAAWQDPNTQVETFEAVDIDGRIEPEQMPSVPHVVLPPGSIDKLVKLKKVVTDNLIALDQGRTPSVVSLDALDGNVHGLVLSLHKVNESKLLANWIQTSFRPGLALQASLFDLTKAAAQTLKQTRFEQDVEIEPQVTVLYDTVLHGTIVGEDWTGDALNPQLTQCELEGIETNNRAIVAVSGERCSVAFGADKSVHQLVQEAALPLRVRRNSIAIFSMQCMSTTSSLLASNAPVIVAKEEPRRPAVSGSFYPADKKSRDELLSQLKSLDPLGKRKVFGVMTPHASVPFSGTVAMRTWEQVELPKTILVISPKHTPHGADWALCPATEWLMSDGRSFSNDLELSKKLAASIDGLHLDSNAHLIEHGIEMQLPFIEHLTSESERPRIVSIAMRGATWSEIQKFASDLAGVLREETELPLLVVSSDMNHFAPDAETRRRDALALEALKSKDPLNLLEVCRTNNISMCGAVPTAIVLQTLKELGVSFRVEETIYQTSAERNQDLKSSVGYAGALFVPE